MNCNQYEEENQPETDTEDDASSVDESETPSSDEEATDWDKIHRWRIILLANFVVRWTILKEPFRDYERMMETASFYWGIPERQLNNSVRYYGLLEGYGASEEQVVATQLHIIHFARGCAEVMGNE